MAREKDEMKKKKSISVAIPRYLVEYAEKMAFKIDVSKRNEKVKKLLHYMYIGV